MSIYEDAWSNSLRHCLLTALLNNRLPINCFRYLVFIAPQIDMTEIEKMVVTSFWDSDLFPSEEFEIIAPTESNGWPSFESK